MPVFVKSITVSAILLKEFVIYHDIIKIIKILEPLFNVRNVRDIKFFPINSIFYNFYQL